MVTNLAPPETFVDIWQKRRCILGFFCDDSLGFIAWKTYTFGPMFAYGVSFPPPVLRICQLKVGYFHLPALSNQEFYILTKWRFISFHKKTIYGVFFAGLSFDLKKYCKHQPNIGCKESNATLKFAHKLKLLNFSDFFHGLLKHIYKSKRSPLMSTLNKKGYTNLFWLSKINVWKGQAVFCWPRQAGCSYVFGEKKVYERSDSPG